MAKKKKNTKSMACEPAVCDESWKYRDDAYTLSKAAEIEADAKRLQRALKEAAKMAKEKEKELEAMKKVAKKASKK